MSLTGLSQRVAYFYPTGVTLLHTSSPSPFRAWLRAVARAWICIEVTRAPVAGRGLVWHRARFHQPRRRAKLGQEEHTCAEPSLPGRGTAVVARQGTSKKNCHWYIAPIGRRTPRHFLPLFISICLEMFLSLVCNLLLFKDGVKFVSIGAMFSELVAVSSKGELYQWKWSEPEPYRNSQVWPC